jgi:hypothetical protein
MSELLEVDIFHNDKYLLTDNIYFHNKEKVKHDIEEVMGFKAAKIKIVAYPHGSINSYEIEEFTLDGRKVRLDQKEVFIKGRQLWKE